MHASASTVDIDINDCPDCCAAGEICPYHRGVADGWDRLALAVGALAQGGDT